jgi:hypothetical protein
MVALVVGIRLHLLHHYLRYGTKKTYRNDMDRVGFEPTTTHVSSANMHARQVFYQAKLPALLKYQVNHVVLSYFIVFKLLLIQQIANVVNILYSLEY